MNMVEVSEGKVSCKLDDTFAEKKRMEVRKGKGGDERRGRRGG
jgi:hypothetical protein